MTLQLALKVTDVELELITDPNIYLMIESGIRGELSKGEFPRYARLPSGPAHRESSVSGL